MPSSWVSSSKIQGQHTGAAAAEMAPDSRGLCGHNWNKKIATVLFLATLKSAYAKSNQKIIWKIFSSLLSGPSSARLGHKELISACFRSSNCISGKTKAPCTEAQSEGSTERCCQEDQEKERRLGNPFWIDFFEARELSPYEATYVQVLKSIWKAKEKAAEPKHVPARLVTWPAVLTALEGLCLSLFDCFCPHVTSVIYILFQWHAQTLGASGRSPGVETSFSPKRTSGFFATLSLGPYKKYWDTPGQKGKFQFWNNTRRPRNSRANLKRSKSTSRRSTFEPYFWDKLQEKSLRVASQFKRQVKMRSDVRLGWSFKPQISSTNWQTPRQKGRPSRLDDVVARIAELYYCVFLPGRSSSGGKKGGKLNSPWGSWNKLLKKKPRCNLLEMKEKTCYSTRGPSGRRSPKWEARQKEKGASATSQRGGWCH